MKNRNENQLSVEKAYTAEQVLQYVFQSVHGENYSEFDSENSTE